MPEIRWKDEPDQKAYAGAAEVLSLLGSGVTSDRLLEKLKDADVVERSASNILRAAFPSGAPFPTPVDLNEELSPLLLVATTGLEVPLIVADGTDRLTSVFTQDPSARVPCKIVHLP